MKFLDTKHNWLLKFFHKILDATTLQYLIILVAQQGLHLHLMDDVTAYLYGSLKKDIYMKITKGFNLPNKENSKEGNSIKLNKPFYWLKQLGCVWYNRLIKYLLKERYRNYHICPCIYMKILEKKFSIIIVYVDDINIVGTPNKLTKAIDYLKKEFEIKDLWRAKFYLRLEIQYLNKGAFIHQETLLSHIFQSRLEKT